MKKCSFCKITKNFSEFYIKHKKGNQIFYRSRCKQCTYSSLTDEQKANRILKSKQYYQKNKKSISVLRKKQRIDPNSSMNINKSKGTQGWINSVFDRLMIRSNVESKSKSIWIKKLEKIYGTNKIFESKRVSNISKSKTSSEIYINWKKEYSKRSNWKNRKEVEYLYEFCYRRVTRALSNKSSNVNKNLWEIRFDSVAGFMRLRA